ncbi:MAG: squalene/phytoene synthase family protein [Hyphomonadaceae bacterium]|nr:squalene/phytoene synthase family protein [Hyphomonadaceae bacterium]
MRETLDTLIQRVDEDRWLAARFSPAHVRERLLAIYAVNYEIARTAETVREGPLGAIRLQWWREALAEIAEGAPPRAHPALAALRRTTNSRTAADLQDIVNARAADFESQPFAAWCDVDRYLDGTAGVLLRVSAEQTEAQPAPSPAFLKAAGRAWGYTGLLRAAAFWRARGRSALPQAGGDFAEMREKAWAFYKEARRFARALPQEVFPAIGYVALVPSYLKAIERGGIERPLLFRQLRLIAASASGKI